MADWGLFLSKMVQFLLKSSSDPLVLSYIDLILHDIGRIIIFFYGVGNEEKEKTKYSAMKKLLEESDKQHLAQYWNKIESSINWDEKIKMLSQLSTLPLLIPPKKVIAKTLKY